MNFKDIKEEEILRILKEQGILNDNNKDIVKRACDEVLFSEKKEIKNISRYDEYEKNKSNDEENIVEKEESNRVKITREELFEYNNDNVLVVKEKYKNNLKQYDLSDVDWTDVDVRNLDFRNTNPDKFDPQVVRNKDCSGIMASADKQEDYIINKDWNFKGVNIKNADLFCKDDDNTLEVVPSIVDANFDYETWKNFPRKFQKYIIEQDKLPEEIIQKAYEEKDRKLNSSTMQDEDTIDIVIAEEKKGRSR